MVIMESEVKEMDAVDIREMADSEGRIYVPVTSSFIEAVSYDLRDGALVVSFHSGDDAAYVGFSFNTFVNFVNADSPGSFYNTFIK